MQVMPPFEPILIRVEVDYCTGQSIFGGCANFQPTRTPRWNELFEARRDTWERVVNGTSELAVAGIEGKADGVFSIVVKDTEE